MAYADQQMSGNKITALIIVALLHVVVGYALVTGLAYSAFKKLKDVTTAVKIDPTSRRRRRRRRLRRSRIRRRRRRLWRRRRLSTSTRRRRLCRW
jgi:hypothetical protein